MFWLICASRSSLMSILGNVFMQVILTLFYHLARSSAKGMPPCFVHFVFLTLSSSLCLGPLADARGSEQSRDRKGAETMRGGEVAECAAVNPAWRGRSRPSRRRCEPGDNRSTERGDSRFCRGWRENGLIPPS